MARLSGASTNGHSRKAGRTLHRAALMTGSAIFGQTHRLNDRISSQ